MPPYNYMFIAVVSQLHILKMKVILLREFTSEVGVKWTHMGRQGVGVVITWE